jgi:hypothetical protein
VIRLNGPWEVRGFSGSEPQAVFHFRGALENAFPPRSMEIERLEYSRRFNRPTGLSINTTVVWRGEIAGEVLGIWLNGEPLKWVRNHNRSKSEVVTESFAEQLMAGQNELECILQLNTQWSGPLLLDSQLRIDSLAKPKEFAD